MPADMINSMSVLNLILGAGTVAKVVLVILFGFSVISWATILERWRLFARAQMQSRRFLRVFHDQDDLQRVHQDAARLTDSPAANVFRTVYGKFARLIAPTGPGLPVEDTQAIVETVYRELDRASHAELAKFEKRLTILATASSVCPFLGLFGTVWGIMGSFLSISARGSTNIAVVAPGIAEALITTAAGLAVAIPATIAYNYFLNRTRKLGLELEELATSFLTIIQLRGRHEEL